MKFTLVVHQAAVVDAGLLGKVGVEDLCLLYYLHGWFFSQNGKRQIVDGRKFVWLHYERAIEELPLLFNPEAKITSRKNQLVGLMQKLREAELVETKRIERCLFFRLTDLAVQLTQRSERTAPTVTKPVSTVTPPHDETVTPGQDKIFMSSRDDSCPTIITETGITEKGTTEAPPLSPSEGEVESILAYWNSFPELPKAIRLTLSRARKIRKRLADPFWREHWREGIKRAAATPFLKGSGSQGWRATLDWFLKGDSLAKIMEGAYDNRPQPAHKPLVSDLKAQLKALDELIANHPANDQSAAYDENAPQEEFENLDKLRHRREELLRQLAALPLPGSVRREKGEIMQAMEFAKMKGDTQGLEELRRELQAL